MAGEVKRGEIWTLAGGKDYGGKPRPAVIVQDDRFDKTESVTVCPFTTDAGDAPLIRISVDPDTSNGLRMPCRLMVDKIMTVSRSKLGTNIGRLADEQLVSLNRAMLVFLGISSPVAR